MFKELIITSEYRAGSKLLVDKDIYDRIKDHTICYYPRKKVVIREPVSYTERVLTRVILNYDYLRYYVEFKNGNDLDYRRSNMRLISRALEKQSRSSRHYNNRYKGVNSNPDRDGNYVTFIWMANIRKRVYLGAYSTPELAASIYDAAIRYTRKEGIYLNFPDKVIGLPDKIRLKLDKCK